MTPERALLLALGERLAYRDDYLSGLIAAVRDAPDRAADVEELVVILANTLITPTPAFGGAAFAAATPEFRAALDRLTQPRKEVMPLGNGISGSVDTEPQSPHAGAGAPPPPAEPDEATLRELRVLIGHHKGSLSELALAAWRFCAERLRAPEPQPVTVEEIAKIVHRARIAYCGPYTDEDYAREIVARFRASASPIPADLIARARSFLDDWNEKKMTKEPGWEIIRDLAELSPQENADGR